MKLDLLICGARVHTMDEAHPRARSVGIWHGHVVALDAAAESLPAAQAVDLRGATVLPGFVDAHTHVAQQGMRLGCTDLSAADSVDAALALIDAAARAGTGWVDASGYDQRVVGRHLHADELDRVSHGRPVFITHRSAHACLANGVVLDRIPAERWTTAPPGVDRDASGRPTGLFRETAQDLVREVRLPYTLAEITAAIRRASELCAAQGITACAEAGIGGGLVAQSPVELVAFARLADADQLPVRVQLMVAGDCLHTTGAAPEDLLAIGLDLGLSTGFGSGRLSIGGMKLWLDGGLSQRAAAVSEPYPDGGLGALAPNIDHYREVVIAAHAAGWQIALHAIGDRAIDRAIEFIAEAQRRHPRADARPRIEHCMLVRPDQLPKLAGAGITAVIQPGFHEEFGAEYDAVLGPARAAWMSRVRSLTAAGVRVAASSDRPVTDGAVLPALGFLVHRTARSGRVIEADEAIGVAAAIRACTADAAWACGLDGEIGSITVRKQADLVVLGADPHEVAACEIADIPVLATLMAGKPRYDPVGLFSA